MSDPRHMLVWLRQYGGAQAQSGSGPARVSGVAQTSSSAYAAPVYNGIAYGAMRNTQLQREAYAARDRGDHDLADYLEHLIAERWRYTFPPRGHAA